MNLVLFLEAAQDRNGVFDGRFLDQHGLEPARQGRILLDVLTVFVQRGRADAGSSPRASAGFSIFDASIAPSEARRRSACAARR